MDEGNSRIQETVDQALRKNPFWQSSWFVAILISLLCGISYWNSLDGKFQYDDHRLIRFNLALRETNWQEIIRSERSRPLSIISFALNYQLGKTAIRSYHAVNIALHFATVFLFYLLLRRTRPEGWFAIISAVLMAIHPLNTESVSYISGRSIVLCAMFYMLAMLSFDSYLRKPSWRTVAGFLISFILAGLSKENAATIPIAAALYALLLYGKESLKQSRKLILVVFLLTVAAGLYRLFIVPDTRVGAYPALTYWTTEINVWVRYLWLSIYPVGLNVDHDVAPLSITNPWFIGALILVTGLCYLLWRVRKTHAVLTFWGLWFFLNLLPSSIIPLHEFMAEHLAYISLFGFCACVSYLLMVVMKPLVKPAPLLWAVVVVICTLSIYGTVQRNKVWKDGISLWTDAAVKSPQRIRPHLNLAEAYIQQKSFDKAINEYSLALSHNPGLK
ncbi:MAG TPA: tetratricopeptide repeat protein, partial [Acidobacteriota bacterium]|nr:tetratricopeptide repeat protein [Acidobacteriota bacterium]